MFAIYYKPVTELEIWFSATTYTLFIITVTLIMDKYYKTIKASAGSFFFFFFLG